MAAPMVAMTLNKPTKLRSTFCAMHIVSSTKSGFISFNSNSWKRFVYFANEWKKYNCKEREVTLETEAKLGLTLITLEEVDVECPNDPSLGYHYDSYKRFCDEHKIRRKESSLTKKRVIQGEVHTDNKHDVHYPVSSSAKSSSCIRKVEGEVHTDDKHDVHYPVASSAKSSSCIRKVEGEVHTDDKHDVHYPVASSAKSSSCIRKVEDGHADLREVDVGCLSSSSGKNSHRPKRGKTSIPWNRRHMFPEECIFCHSNKYKRNPISGKRTLMRLVKCELVSGGQLLKAAKVKQDSSLLREIDGEDLVARELQYHQDCYKDYIRQLSRRERPSTGNQQLYVDAYTQFSEQIIKTRLILGKEILTLNRLNKLFIEMIKEESGIESFSRTWNLKKRLQNDFPQLVFVRPAKRNVSEIVFCETLSAEDLVEDFADGNSSAESSTNESDGDESFQHSLGSFDDAHTLYNAALIMKSIVNNHKPTPIPWPAQATHLTLERAKHEIPHLLYNFLAWLVGSSSDPNKSEFVTVSEESHCKILSIAQDIIYLASRGRNPMPKHTALATAVRHLTGSTQLIGILNVLGHSIAHPTLLEHNTALAKCHIALGDTVLPPGIQCNSFTTLVWDNIDFGEETLSGKGTTHSTNAIMIQWSQQLAQDVDMPTETALKRSRDRTLVPPPTDISPFMGHGKKKGPVCSGAEIDVHTNMQNKSELEARKLDFAYNLLKFKSSGIPSWTGFNTLLCLSYPPKSTVAYLPALNASPTQMDTVQTILTRSIEYADALGVDVVALVFDQAIYAKAQQIRWRDESLQKRIVIRLGMFHTKMTYLACIGKRFKDAGLSDIIVESGLTAQGSINGVMNGHHYNRSMRAHKVMHDALRQLQFEAFMDSFSTEDERFVANELISNLYAAFNQGDISEEIDSHDFIRLTSSFTKFVETMSKANATFAFWTSYINMVEDVLLLTRATRTGNWELHMSIIRRILPWMFAYDRPNYSRYLSAYYMEMCDLATTHPSVHEELVNGNFAVQRQEEHGFSQIECDLCIEQTCNRDAKTKGGLIGFTTNQGAVLRWLLPQHQCSEITNNCKAMAGKDITGRSRKELDYSRIQRDEMDVKAVVSTIRSMINPFEVEGSNLLHISSGIVASEDVANDLLKAECIGNGSFATFCKDRLKSNKEDFFSPIKRQKLATFETATKKTVSKIKGKTVTLKADRRLFARLMFIAKVRNVNLRHMMTYCLGPLPLPLATEQGALVKTNKATFMHHLEGEADDTTIVETIPAGSVWLIDGMAMLQQLHSPSAPTTFLHLAEYLLQKLIKLAASHSSPEIHFVTDTYPSISIKNAERKHRGMAGIEVVKINVSSTNQKRPVQWKKFLSASQNKESFVEYLLHVWKRCSPAQYRNVTVFIAHGKECHALQAVSGKVQVTPILELNCDHEEADTRLILHANYVSNHLQLNANHSSPSADYEAPAVVIKSPDTDVFIIGLGIAHQIRSSLLFHTGRGDTVRTLHLNRIQSQLGLEVATSLIGLHPFTGCDSCSGFFGKGKVKAFKLLKNNDHYITIFSELGASFNLSDSLLSSLDKFVCHLYGQESAEDVNEARYNLFRLGTHAEECLPPNKDALKNHTLRANYQAAVFRRSCRQYQHVPSPAGRGWKIMTDDDNQTVLEVDWCSLPPAPEHILELTNCTCKKSKCRLPPSSRETGVEQTTTCCCELGMHCTELCTCKECNNRQEEGPSDQYDDGVTDSDED